MKTQLLTAAFATTLLMTLAAKADASDLSLTFSSLQSALQFDPPPLERDQRLPRTQPLILGAYFEDVEVGLKVTGTVSASPADKVLQPGDVVCRIAALGQPTRTIETLNQLEYAKRAIGPNRQAVLQVYRPGLGTQFVPVTFLPVNQAGTFAVDNQPASVVSMFDNQPDNPVTP